MSTLTGRQRHRVSLLGKLVLQVEVEVTPACAYSGAEGPKYNIWRDAKVEDLTVQPTQEGAVYATQQEA
jgi:hypothetical protein